MSFNSKVVLFVLASLMLAFGLKLTDVRTETLYYSGRIDARLLNKLADPSSGEVERLVLNSQGGDIAEAIEIAKIIQKEDISVVVDGYCFSACASIVLPASSNRVVESGSVIGFHNLIGFWYYLNKYLEAEGGPSLAGSMILGNAKDVIKIFENSGINPDLFLALANRQGISCIELSKDVYNLTSEDVFIDFEADLYIPNENLLSAFGWKFSNASFPDVHDIDDLGRQISADFPHTSFKIENPDFSFPRDVIEMGLEIKSIQECSTEFEDAYSEVLSD